MINLRKTGDRHIKMPADQYKTAVLSFVIRKGTIR